MDDNHDLDFDGIQNFKFLLTLIFLSFLNFVFDLPVSFYYSRIKQ